MLFSEPKIPQSLNTSPHYPNDCGFSALQRAENSSIFDRETRDFAVEYVSVLFSEPKIPQCCVHCAARGGTSVSVLFSEPKIPQCPRENQPSVAVEFQCSSASRKFLNRTEQTHQGEDNDVSVLFSEPKIPQSLLRTTSPTQLRSFSALQRAENSSIVPNYYRNAKITSRFSALQRAENSSIETRAVTDDRERGFQCSSASRKFLNAAGGAHRAGATGGLSALQRAENSSIDCAEDRIPEIIERFQCSSASRKFLNRKIRTNKHFIIDVSVLFSEPKIPQSSATFKKWANSELFQCSSASRKFLN